jgi:hypothetical protein
MPVVITMIERMMLVILRAVVHRRSVLVCFGYVGERLWLSFGGGDDDGFGDDGGGFGYNSSLETLGGSLTSAP